jgi:hypothetical protein
MLTESEAILPELAHHPGDTPQGWGPRCTPLARGRSNNRGANDGMGRRHASATKTIRLLEDDLFVTVVNAHGLQADNATLYCSPKKAERARTLISAVSLQQ